ncbi:M-phase phosphoprotein 9-like [Diadema antillarum]|uniref:M-phase phosphoprotein 9-like n=1 Tax=Diadema antillarum TaxID=105358 RepID=UPI003A87E622
MSEDTKDAKERDREQAVLEDGDNELSESSDTSAWDSDPLTPRTRRQLLGSLSYFPQTRVMFLPSLGSLEQASLGAMMGELFAATPSLDIAGQESDSDWGERGSLESGREADDDSISSRGEQGGRRQDQENVEELFIALKRQHVEQMRAQQEQHRKQMAWLKKQLLSGTDHVDSNMVPLLDQDDASSDTSTFVSGSLDNTQMTTWSDVHDQRHGSDAVNPEDPTTQEAVLLQQMQQNFEREQAALQNQYEKQVGQLQQEWQGLQQQHVQQRQLVAGMLEQQRSRLEQATQPQIDGEETSSVLSDFTYWRLDEGETYKDLPNAKPKGGQLSLEKDSLVSEDPLQESTTPQEEMFASSQGHGRKQKAKVVESPRTSSSRIDLQEKYTRHIADLEAYYETELDDLRRQLAQAKLGASPFTGEQGELGGESIPDKEGLVARCKDLEGSLTTANGRIQDLENTVRALETRLLEWPDRYGQANSTIAVLQQRSEDLVKLVKKREEVVKQLEKQNRKLESALFEAQQVQDAQTTAGKKEQAMLSKLIGQYTQLSEQHERTQAELLKVQMTFEEANSSISELKRTAVRQELEIKQLEGEKRRLQQGRADSARGDGNSSRSSSSLGPIPSDVGDQPGHSEPALPGMEESSPMLNGFHGDDAVISPRQTQVEPESVGLTVRPASSNSPATALGSSLRLSVEDRKFLRSGANYNILTGQVPRQSEPSLGDVKVTGPQSDATNQAHVDSTPEQLPVLSFDTLEPPFDSDLDDRPLSPMMKAAAQLDRWKTSGRSPRKYHPQVVSLPRVSLGQISREVPERDFSPPKGGAVTDAQLMSYKNRTNSGKKSDGKGDDMSSKRDAASKRVASGRDSGGKQGRTNYKRASTIGEHLHPGKDPDPSLHVWAIHQSPTTALSSGSKNKNSKTSPRGAAVEKVGAMSPGQAARKSLAKYSVGESSGSERRKRSSPRRNLAASFKDADMKKGDRGGTTSKAVQTPVIGGDPFEAALQRVRQGHVTTRADWENGLTDARKAAQRNVNRMTSKTSETPEEILRRLSKESKRLDELMIEKRKLESALTHMPNSGPTSAKKLEQQEKLEQRLDQVTRELGSVRMLLRKYNALNMSF